MDYKFPLMLGGMILLFAAYAVYNYRRGVARLGAFKVSRDTEPVWFKIYTAINAIVLGGGLLFIGYYMVQSLT